MNDLADLRQRLKSLEGKSYGGYKEIEGEWVLPSFRLLVDHVQGDPFAAPSRLRVFLPSAFVGLDREAYRPTSRARGVEALMARRFARIAEREGRRRGSGRSGDIGMQAPGQEVLPQTAVRIADDGSLEARFTVGLPARGRRILGGAAAELLCEDLPSVIYMSLRAEVYPDGELMEAARTNEDADHLRAQLNQRALVAFIAEGAVLPRASGADDRPLKGPDVVPFVSPPELRVMIPVPNRGDVVGMGVPRGVTLIVGGGYHGKSTLLQALQWGVYNHRPGDGRELVVSDPATVKVRAEDGRSVSGVDISPFIGTLPGGRETRFFSTSNASGSTSQAAGIVEAIEAGAKVLLIDEDTAATNFMIRDRRMQMLVPKRNEPITPFVDRVRQIHEQRSVSCILVIGGSGDYLDVADTVVAMGEYVPTLATARARAVAEAVPTGRAIEATGLFRGGGPRIPIEESVDPRRGQREARVQVRGTREIGFGRETIDLSLVEQIVSVAQARAIAQALLLARDEMDDRKTFSEVLDAVLARIEKEGLDVLDDRMVGDLAAFRRFELAAALNRLRTLQVQPTAT